MGLKKSECFFTMAAKENTESIMSVCLYRKLMIVLHEVVMSLQAFTLTIFALFQKY